MQTAVANCLDQFAVTSRSRLLIYFLYTQENPDFMRVKGSCGCSGIGGFSIGTVWHKSRF
jgi:hypothetical protein